VDGKAEGIYVGHLDISSGELTLVTAVSGEGAINPSYLATAPDGGHVYAVNELTGDGGFSHGTLSTFATESSAYNLQYRNQRSTYGLAPCFVSLDREGRYCLVANYESGSVCVLPISGEGALEEVSATVSFSGSGPHPQRQRGPHAHMIVPWPADDLVLAVDLGADRLHPLRLDGSEGRLTPAKAPPTQMAPGTGPRHVVFHPHRPFAYVMGELRSNVTAFRLEEKGSLREVQTASTLPSGWGGRNLGAALKIAPSGAFLYASNRGHDSLAVYAVDEESGRLSPRGYQLTLGAGPRDFALDPSGTVLAVANQDSDTVATFWVDQDSGALEPTGRVTRVPTPVCIVMTPVAW
jgi:6-phosphogluconolactonase